MFFTLLFGIIILGSDNMIDLWKYEKELFEKGINYIGGTDEAGRGPLFGPVVAACVVLPKDFYLEGLNDSKKLTEKKRDKFYDYITEHAIWAVGIVSPEEIDEINIYAASRKAMIMAIREVQKQTSLEYVLTDAMPMEIDIPTMSIIKGDAKSITIAAASVIAKVTRDRLMYEADEAHPEYGFKNHKGYPTKKHLEAINEYGLIDGYRLTYGPVKEIKEREYESGSNPFNNLSTVKRGFNKTPEDIINERNSYREQSVNKKQATPMPTKPESKAIDPRKQIQAMRSINRMQ